jgi:anthranilate phosphoribosyltransferase
MTHPFAQYIQILGKGQRGARDMSADEAEQSMSMILDGQVEPEQLGAFLMLMRVKEETPSEVAGFVRAARHSLTVPPGLPVVDLDWSSYAGKRRQLPWFVLSALLLANHGIKVLMHGTETKSAGRVFTPAALDSLGMDICSSFAQATQHLLKRNFAYLPLAVLNPKMQHLLDLKDTLGLRSPIHTVVRMLNPAGSSTSLMGIFHPGYDEVHQAAGEILKDQNLAVFKGEGGESERNPDSACQVRMLVQGKMYEETWPALFSSRHMKDEKMDVSRLGAVWRGEIKDEYAQAAILSTAAIAFRAIGHAASIEEAEQQAADCWQRRDLNFV